MSTQHTTVKSTILETAGAATTFAAHLASLVAHLTTAPNQWTRQASGASHLIAELKAAYTDGQPASVDPRVGVRTADGDVFVMNDPGKTMALGATFSGSAQASPEGQSTEPSGLYTKSLLMELDDCLIWLMINAAKTACPWGMKLGNSIQTRPGMQALGIDGHVALSGSPRRSSGSVSGLWYSDNSGSSFVKLGTVTARWEDAEEANSIPSDGELDTDDDSILESLPQMYSVRANDAASSSDDVIIGYDRYWAEIPDRVRGTQPSFTVIEGATQAWLYVNYTGSNINEAMPWEKGVSLSGL